MRRRYRIRACQDLLPKVAQIRRRSGSLAIFLCLVLAGLVLVFNSWLQAARVRAAEADLSQAMTAQLQVTLASYDQEMFDHFGLFGFRAEAIDRQVFRGSLSTALQACPLELEPGRSLTDPTVLDRQMVRQMKARLPGAWLDLFATRWSDLNGLFSSLLPTAGDALGKDLQRLPEGAVQLLAAGDGSLLAAADTTRIGSLSDLLRTAFRSLSTSLIRQTAAYLFDQLLDELLEEAEIELLADMQQLYRQFTTESLGVGDNPIISDLLGGLPDFFNPQSLTRMATSLEQLLDFSTYPIYEKLCVVEYIMSYLTQRTTGQVVDGQWQPLLTPDGRAIQDLLPARPGEIEQIVVGIEDAQLAAGTVRFMLISIRSLIHVAAILTDETRMAVIRGAAATLVAAIAAASLGSVVIEPEAVTYLIVAAEALATGIRESGRLINGQGVRFWPGKGQITFNLWYGDYLRLILYGLPRVTLVTRCGRILDRLNGQTLFTELTVTTRFGGRTLSLNGGYG